MKKHVCYILFSPSVNKFYIGETSNIEERLELHNSGVFKSSFTKIADDWELYLYLECENRAHARRVESFIKRMKSSKFIERLKESKQMKEDIVLKNL